MELMRCKMCGGDLRIDSQQGFGTCEYCGSTMTLPKATDERVANLYNRANHYRLQHDFDKALSAYENILNEAPDDAEAHWGVVLRRYGIEYVEDPVSHDRLPTEAEWEYAAKGGKKSNGYLYAGGNKARSVAWYSDNSGRRTQQVGTKAANELGLYDMSGNVWE